MGSDLWTYPETVGRMDLTGFDVEAVDELDRMRVVRFDGAFDDLRLRRWLRLVTVGIALTSVHCRRCNDGLPDIGERRLVQVSRQVR